MPNAIVRERAAASAGRGTVSHRAPARRDVRPPAGRYAARRMGKTLVIAEKPSVGQDLARVLPGPFEKHTGRGRRPSAGSRAPSTSSRWAVGHLVQLAEPDEYDDKFKKWRMADLPIVPSAFKLVVRDERSQKQMIGRHASCSSATTSTSSSTPATPAARAS